jgi:hypothetical protein
MKVLSSAYFLPQRPQRKNRKIGMMEYWNVEENDCLAHHSIIPNR